jgi:hypothetical protein
LLLISRRRRSAAAAAAESACRGSERVLVVVQVAFLGLGVEGGAGRQAGRQQTLVVERTNERARFSSSLYVCLCRRSAFQSRDKYSFGGHESVHFLVPESQHLVWILWRTFCDPEGDCEMNLEGRGMEAMMAISSS